MDIYDTHVYAHVSIHISVCVSMPMSMPMSIHMSIKKKYPGKSTRVRSGGRLPIRYLGLYSYGLFGTWAYIVMAYPVPGPI